MGFDGHQARDAAWVLAVWRGVILTLGSFEPCLMVRSPQCDTEMALQKQKTMSYLEVIKGRISIFNILMRSSPGKEKYCFSCTESRAGVSAGS